MNAIHPSKVPSSVGWDRGEAARAKEQKVLRTCSWLPFAADRPAQAHCPEIGHILGGRSCGGAWKVPASLTRAAQDRAHSSLIQAAGAATENTANAGQEGPCLTLPTAQIEEKLFCFCSDRLLIRRRRRRGTSCPARACTSTISPARTPRESVPSTSSRTPRMRWNMPAWKLLCTGPRR
jgi:hypothetical protein